MIKYLFIAAAISYFFRRLILSPVPGSKAFYDNEQRKMDNKDRKSSSENEYLDYEEIN